MQPKRPLSPVPLPPSKRLHAASSTAGPSTHAPRPTFDTLLYDEIVLVIFSYLSWADLCMIQATNRNWSRLALDNQLWKSLYLNEYGRTRLRGVRGFIGRADGREVRPLPGRVKSEDVKDWKWMFRISSNWRTGRCTVQLLDASPERPNRRAILPDPSSGRTANDVDEQMFLLLAGSMTISACSRVSSSPTISLTSQAHATHTLRCPSTRPSVQTHITALALDQSPPSSTYHVRLVSFLATGEFALFSIDHQTPAHSSRVLIYVPSTRHRRTSPIIQAVYHHPILVTLSQSFYLSLYDLSDNSVTHTQTLSSFTSHPPSSLVLSSPTPGTFRLVLAYAIPVYPSHWSVGATELMILSGSQGGFTVTGTRTTRAIDVPQGWIDEHKMRQIREQWGRKVARVADTQTDGKWVVLAPGGPLVSVSADPHPASPPSSSSPPSSPSRSSIYTSSSLHSASALQLYRLHLPPSTSITSAPKLTFVRSLHGQIGPVSAVAVADGRCVSLGMNGRIWVWDLEAGTGAEVSSGSTGSAEDEDAEGESASEHQKVRTALPMKGTAVFDERRIMSADVNGVRVWRFDV